MVGGASGDRCRFCMFRVLRVEVPRCFVVSLVQIYVQLSDAYTILSEPYRTTNVLLSRSYARVNRELLRYYPIGGLLIHN